MSDKALLLGINDYKSVTPLRGCVNDVENMKGLLTGLFHFDEKNVKTLLNQRVVKSDVKKQLAWLFDGTKSGDRVVLHFSGHGSYTANDDQTEADESGADELICLYDMDFNDPDSYLLDDELRHWTQTLPDGVQLTIVLDNCHSGSGTRLVMAPVAGKTQHQRQYRIDDKATLKRTLAATASTGARDAGAVLVADRASEVLDPQSDDAVRVRFVDPPPAIKARVGERRRAGSRGMVRADLNHILLAGCRDDQTSADARIGGTFSGAFTYYLCKALREGGATLDRRTLIERVEQALRENQFSQVPQLEARSGSGPLFGRARGGGATAGRTDVGLGSGQSGAPPVPDDGAPSQPTLPQTSAGDQSSWTSLLTQILGPGRALEPDIQRKALDLLERIVLGGGQQPAAKVRATGTRQLVYVHGICRHDGGYSNGWWGALRPFTGAYGDGTLGGTRHEVLWSDLVNERALRELSGRGPGDESADRAALSALFRGALEERAAAVALQEAPRVVSSDLIGMPLARDLFGDDAAADRGLSIPGLNCIDDFSAYMLNDSVRAQVIGRFTQVVRPLLEAGGELDVISHSWGTVVAYEALRELDAAGLGAGRVRNFFTVGAALAIGPVKSRLRRANRDGRKPSLVRRWINLDARGDPVGGAIQGRPFQVDAEFLELPNLGCGFLDFSCAHSSYFKPANERVNRDVFGAFINQA